MKSHFTTRFKKTKRSEKAEAMPAAIITAIISSLLLLGIASVVSMVVQSKSDSQTNVTLATIASNIDVSLRSDVTQASYITASAKLKQPTARLLTPTDVLLSGVNMHVPQPIGECKVVRWSINGNTASRDLTVYKSSLKDDSSVKCDETSPVLAKRTKIFAQNVNVKTPFKFHNQVGREIVFNIETGALDAVNTKLDAQLTAKGVQKLSDSDFNELNKTMKTDSYTPGFVDACVMNATKVSGKCPEAEADTVAAAWGSLKIAKVSVIFEMATQTGETVNRNIEQNSSVPLYASAAEAEAAVASSSADNRPAAPVVSLSTSNVILGTNYTISWTVGGICPTNMVKTYKVYENNVLVNTTAGQSFVKNYTNSATEFLNYAVQIDCVRGALIVSSDMSAVATAKVIPAVPALVINAQPAATNAPLNSNLTSTATCLYGTSPRYNIIQTVSTFGVVGTTVSNVTTVNRAINNGFPVVEGARYQYRVEAWCISAYDKSSLTNTSTNPFTTVINVPAAPAFTGPAANATNVAINATVTWNAVICATGTTVKYYSYKDINAGAAIAPQVIDNWTTDLSLVSNNTQGNTVGYGIQARCEGSAVGVNSAGSTPTTRQYTTVINVPAIGAPFFTSPAEGATAIATNATVTWSSAVCAPATTTQYYTTKNINANAAITAQIIDNWTTDVSLVSNNTEGNTVGYTVAARCAGPNANSGASATDTLKYTTAINAPATPLFTSPAEGAMNIATNATVTWGAVTCATGTNVQYFTTKNVNAGVGITAQVIDNWTVGNTLATNNTQGNTVGYTVAGRCVGPNSTSVSSGTDTVKFTTLITAPAAPLFTAPAEGATNIATNASVTWGAVVCPPSTTTKYYSTKNINAGVGITAQVIDNWTTDLNLVSNNTQGNTVGYTLAARCDGPNAVSTSTATDTLKYTTLITAPATPLFTAPAEGAMDIAINATVTWSVAVCATGTTVQYYTTKNMNNGAAITPVVIDNWTAGNTLASSNTQGSRVGYTVAARCVGPNVTSASSVSDALTYTTLVSAPAGPLFTSPAEAATNVATNATVTWSAVTCAAGTTVKYYTTKNMNAGSAITPIVIDNWTAGNTLASNNTQGNRVGYTVAARCDGANDVSSSSATDALTYRTIINAPTAPLFTAPAEGATNIATNATVSWSVAVCATATTVQYYTTKNMNVGVSDPTPTVIDNWTAGNTLATANTEGNRVGYTVQARCVGPNVTSTSSAIDSLTYVTRVNTPAMPTFTSPADAATWITTSVAVNWNAVTCGTGMTVQYYMAKNLNAGVIDPTPTVIENWTPDVTTMVSNTQGNRVGYTVQARCVGPNANSASSAADSITFTTRILAPSAPVFTAPAEGATNVATNATVTWSAVTCPTATTVKYYTTKNMNAGVIDPTPTVIDNWTAGNSLASNNTQGNRVGYTVAARCEGSNVDSAATATDTLTYTTEIDAPNNVAFIAPTPAAGATRIPTNATLAWSSVTCAAGTTAKYYSYKDMNAGVVISRIVMDSWTTDVSYVTNNSASQGSTVRYNVAARCEGPNVSSVSTPTVTRQYTTDVDAPGGAWAWNNNYSTVLWNPPSAGCAGGANIQYRIHQTKADNNAVSAYGAWTTGSSDVLPTYNTGGYPQWAEVQTKCVGPNAESVVDSGNMVKWVKHFAVSFSAAQQWRRINVWASCPYATNVGSFDLYVAADGWWGARGVYGGISTDEGAWIADAQAGGGGNSGWIPMDRTVNTQWNAAARGGTTYNWGYWGNAGWGSDYATGVWGANMSGTYWNASGWGSWAYWWAGSCSSPYMTVYAKNGVWTGGGIRNAGNPGAYHNSFPTGVYLTAAGNNAIR